MTKEARTVTTTTEQTRCSQSLALSGAFWETRSLSKALSMAPSNSHRWAWAVRWVMADGTPADRWHLRNGSVVHRQVQRKGRVADDARMDLAATGHATHRLTLNRVDHAVQILMFIICAGGTSSSTYSAPRLGAGPGTCKNPVSLKPAPTTGRTTTMTTPCNASPRCSLGLAGTDGGNAGRRRAGAASLHAALDKRRAEGANIRWPLC